MLPSDPWETEGEEEEEEEKTDKEGEGGGVHFDGDQFLLFIFHASTSSLSIFPWLPIFLTPFCLCLSAPRLPPPPPQTPSICVASAGNGEFVKKVAVDQSCSIRQPARKREVLTIGRGYRKSVGGRKKNGKTVGLDGRASQLRDSGWLDSYMAHQPPQHFLLAVFFFDNNTYY